MQVFYSQMCDLIKLGLNGRVFQCPRGNRGNPGNRGNRQPQSASRVSISIKPLVTSDTHIFIHTRQAL